jgi:ABC-2 type transport system ATP-binding protein
MSKSILVVENLFKIFRTGTFLSKLLSKYEEFIAVDNISFELKEGEILGILGPNGAGKTTTIQMLLDLLTPTRGKITYFGKDLFTHKTKIMEHVAFASSYLKLPSALTVYETLIIYSKIYGLSHGLQKKEIEKNLEFFGLEKVKDRLTKHLSAGQLTRLALAKSFLPKPKILLLDEPTAALDPDIAQQIRKYILQERKYSNLSVLFTSHNMYEVEEMCDRILVLKNGKIIASETPKNLTSKVRTSHVKLMLENKKELLLNYLEERKLNYKFEGNFIDIDIVEYKISDLLIDLSKLGINYSQISIDKPSLEDYFLQISKL